MDNESVMKGNETKIACTIQLAAMSLPCLSPQRIMCVVKLRRKYRRELPVPGEEGFLFNPLMSCHFWRRLESLLTDLFLFPKN